MTELDIWNDFRISQETIELTSHITLAELSSNSQSHMSVS